MSDLTPEIDGKMRQFKRALMSCADFKHAKLASSYILSEGLHEKYPEKSYIVLEALNCSMIVAYCRPFSGNDSGCEHPVPDIPSRLLKVLNEEERIVHDAVMHDRNTVLAHSDSDALQMEPVLERMGERDILLSIVNWGLAPLTPDATKVFNSAAEKLLNATIQECQRLRVELSPYLRVVNPGDLLV
jgi:hypothetical protein